METTVEPNIETMKRADLPVIWEDFRTQAEKLKATADTLTVTDVSQVAEMKLARQTRLTLKNLRVAIDAKRKELGEFHLRETQKINTSAKELKDLIEPLETRLLEQEQFAERTIAAQKEELRAMRAEELAPFGINGSFYNLAEMPDADYDLLYANSRAAHEAKVAAELKVAQERIERARIEAEERERLRVENDQLKKEAEKREATAKAERAKSEAAAKTAADKARKEREAIEAKARAEREAAEAKAKAEREAAEAIARKERQAREKAEAELKAKHDAEVKARDLAAAAAKKAERAPDKTKLAAFSKMIRDIAYPKLTSGEGKLIEVELSVRLSSVADWIDTKVKSL